jgi:hypothetical protein
LVRFAQEESNCLCVCIFFGGGSLASCSSNSVRRWVPVVLLRRNSRARAEDKPPYTADSDHVRHTPLCTGMSQKCEHRIIK